MSGFLHTLWPKGKKLPGWHKPGCCPPPFWTMEKPRRNATQLSSAEYQAFLTASGPGRNRVRAALISMGAKRDMKQRRTLERMEKWEREHIGRVKW